MPAFLQAEPDLGGLAAMAAKTGAKIATVAKSAVILVRFIRLNYEATAGSCIEIHEKDWVFYASNFTVIT